MKLVVDACVGIKWFIPEPHAEIARRLRYWDDELLVPSHFFIEMCSTLVKKTRLRGGEGLSEPEARELWRLAVDFPAASFDVQPLFPLGLDIALRHRRSVHDSLYVALALRERCQFVTADRKLYNATAAAYPDTMLWVEEIPQL